jgi:hypothetical protein
MQMSTTDPAQARPAVGQYPAGDVPAYAYSQRGDTLVMFAGTILALLATMNFIYGIAAVSKSKFFVGEAKFVFSDLKTWGWVLIIVAVVQLATAFGVWLRWTGVRWVGVAIAGINAVVQLLAVQAYPLWALSLFAMDVLVIYGLLAYGGRRTA